MRSDIDFAVDSPERFTAFCQVFTALKADKDANGEDTSTRHRAGKWHAFCAKGRYRKWSVVFEERALTHFWWSTTRERRGE